MVPRQWLIIDTSHAEGMRFTAVRPSDHPTIGAIHTVRTDGLPTFTDVLQAYARESGNNLAHFDPLLCIAGAASGESITLARSNWTITRTGISALFGTSVRVINDVVAMAWASMGGRSRASAIRGARMSPDFAKPGRMAMVFVGGGVGAAIVDIGRDGRVHILETEAGRMDFAASNERELRLADARRENESYVSWEQMLVTTESDAAWQTLPDVRVEERQRLLGDLFGRYLANLIHAYGAWNGVMLAGPRIAQLSSGNARIAFDGAFTKKRPFGRLLMQTPVWSIDQNEAVLNGGAVLMAIRTREARETLAA